MPPQRPLRLCILGGRLRGVRLYFLKLSCTADSCGFDGFGEFVCGRLKPELFDANYVMNSGLVWNENFQVQNGRQPCFCLQLSLILPVLLHALKSIWLFWRHQLAISNFKTWFMQIVKSFSSRRSRVLLFRSELRWKKILGSPRVNKCLAPTVQAGLAIVLGSGRFSYNNAQKCGEITSRARFAHAY